MREILKGERKGRVISKALLCVLLLFMVLGFMPMDVHATNPNYLVVNGIDILSAQDNTVICGEGTAKYDSTTNTLSLENATISQIDDHNCAIYCGGGDLTIELIGTNTITSTNRGIYTSGYSLNFKGNGSLMLNTTNEGIQADNSDIVIDGCTMNITTNNWGGVQVYGYSVGGTLTIKNDANITVNSAELSLVGENGITIMDSYVEATVSNSETNGIYSESGKVGISNSTVKVKETADNPYPAIWAYEMEISDNSDVVASTTGSNAIYSLKTLSITNSSLTAGSPNFTIWCNDSITISGSTIRSVDTGGDSTDPAIHTGNTLTITNGSDVLADGGITAVNGLTVTPVNGSLVEFKAGIHENGEQGATHRGNSPYSEEFSFENEDIELGYTYIHIKDHTHTGNTANCTDKATCTDCGKSFGDIDPNNHKNLTKIDAKSPTHLKAGNIEYYYCDGCGKYFRDKNGTEEISFADTVISKIAGHTVDNTGWRSDENNHWNTCECGEILNKTSHTFKWVIDKEATDTTTGSKHEECTMCGYPLPSVEIPAVGHTYKSEWAYDEVSHWHDCESCDAKTDGEKHVFEWVIDKEATTVEAGSKHEECAVCGYQKEAVDIPKITVTKEDAAAGTMALNKKIKATWSGSNLAVTWGKVSKADGYEVYAAKCGNKYTKVKTVKGNSALKYTVKKINGKKLNTKTTYKVRVKAYRLIGGKKKYTGTSYGMHTAGLKNKTYTNAKSVKAAKKSVTLKKGKTRKASVKITKQTSKKELLKASHVAKLRYFSTNTKVATVTKAGTIKAAGKGTCAVYALAANGVKTTVKVTVK